MENDNGKAKIAFPPINPDEVTCDYLSAIEFTAGRPTVTVPAQDATEEKQPLKDVTCLFGTPQSCTFRDNRCGQEIQFRISGSALIGEADTNEYPDKDSLTRKVRETIIAALPEALSQAGDTVHFWEIHELMQLLKELLATALRQEGLAAEISINTIDLREEDRQLIHQHNIDQLKEDELHKPTCILQKAPPDTPAGKAISMSGQPQLPFGMMDGEYMIYDPDKQPPQFHAPSVPPQDAPDQAAEPDA